MESTTQISSKSFPTDDEHPRLAPHSVFCSRLVELDGRKILKINNFHRKYAVINIVLLSIKKEANLLSCHTWTEWTFGGHFIKMRILPGASFFTT